MRDFVARQAQVFEYLIIEAISSNPFVSRFAYLMSEGDALLAHALRPDCQLHIQFTNIFPSSNLRTHSELLKRNEGWRCP